MIFISRSEGGRWSNTRYVKIIDLFQNTFYHLSLKISISSETLARSFIPCLEHECSKLFRARIKKYMHDLERDLSDSNRGVHNFDTKICKLHVPKPIFCKELINKQPYLRSRELKWLPKFFKFTIIFILVFSFIIILIALQKWIRNLQNSVVLVNSRDIYVLLQICIFGNFDHSK